MKKFKDYLKPMNEGNIDQMIEDISNLTGKGAQVAWDHMEQLSNEFGLYAGDSTPDDYLEQMSDKQIKDLHKKIKKYL